MKKTPLCEMHQSLNAKMVDFAGWYMPVQYQGIKEEHLCVRQNVGLFDVSHMGEIDVRGPKALETLQWVTTNDVAALKAGEAQYSLLPNAQGGLVDDLIVYCVEPNREYLLCVNASNTENDFAHLQANNRGAELVNSSQDWAQIAVQGPKADALLDEVFAADISNMISFTFAPFSWKKGQCLVARTGYTGERGAEIFVRPDQAVALWTALLELGAKYSVAPIGLGARDTLRTEMKYSLYGHEIDATTNAYEAGLGWVVKPAKKDFLGKTEILRVKERGLKKKLVGFKLKDRGIPRQGMKLLARSQNLSKDAAAQEIGWVTSGTLSPSLNEPIGIAYIDVSSSEVGSEFDLDVRGRRVPAVVVKTPFVTPGSERKD